MYNRYIPPAQSKASPIVSNTTTKPETQLQQVGADAATTFTRYVPARKSKLAEAAVTATQDNRSPASKRKHDDSFEAGGSPAPQPKKSKSADKAAAESDESDNGRSKSRKDKKSDKKKKKSRKSHSEEAEVSLEPRSDDDSEDEDEDETATKKRKKEKRDKPKKKKSEAEEGEEEDDSKPSRHASIMAKKSKALQVAAVAPTTDGDAMDLDEPAAPEDLEMHGLEPLPQPEPVAIDTSKPTYETLPSWLAEPIRVAPDTRTPFTEIGISAKATKVLESKGYKDAFAVQTAAIPLLLPSCKHPQGDLLVAAATGSGKTLAYALPIVRDISRGQITRLRALIVLPTRELVNQAQEVFQLCANAFDGKEAKRVRVGISIGSQQLKQDQASLVEKTQRYDPKAYQQALKREQKQWEFVEDSDSDDDSRPVAGKFPDHVVDYNSKVDVLICTPGRLVDHINQTPGFSLDYVRWLVVDEADKLLAQSFQGWLDAVMPKLSTTKFSARDFPDSNLTGVRKVILSATLTRDLSLLGGLQLRKPQLIVLEGGKGEDKAQTAEHTLPSQMQESAVRVYNVTLKPLYLLELLQGEHLLSPAGSTPSSEVAKAKKADADDTSSDSDSDTSSSESESDSDSDSDSDTSSSSGDSDAGAKKTQPPKGSFKQTVLIFTKSNESALRLSRLLALLSPSLAPLIGTLTSTQKTSLRRRVLSSFTAGSLRILVASDLVARGIDLPSLDNVINYDLPASAAGYVHRVGRTARAGRAGRAITLVETRESGWFWGAVGKWAGIRRHGDVGRLKIGDKDAEHSGFDKEKVEEYQKALDALGKEAGEAKRHR